jgi:methylated-DNA-[protein]-cysteine S-methyltransferase
MKYTYLTTRVGKILLAADDSGLRLISFETEKSHPQPDADWTEDADALAGVSQQLEAYFAGQLEQFDLELAPRGTPFQLKVWKELERIPYGTTISYQELAERIGNPKAVRAVGTANGANPLPIVIPCHRVIGADGSLTGYGGGLDKKEALLTLEGALLDLEANT